MCNMGLAYAGSRRVIFTDLAQDLEDTQGLVFLVAEYFDVIAFSHSFPDVIFRDSVFFRSTARPSGTTTILSS